MNIPILQSDEKTKSITALQWKVVKGKYRKEMWRWLLRSTNIQYEFDLGDVVISFFIGKM
jgi:hypothetical protein